MKATLRVRLHLWWEDMLVKWACDFMGWHGRLEYIAGTEWDAQCMRCGYEGLVDSQGNLF